ncbi:MAG: shikimate dehydrogenase [Gammaproteobacteria bacterium]|nr:shikimate dehydrogenase [Gammaproteobacteria bacterium]
MHADSAPLPDLYCVMGNPVAHSRSPQIHAAFAAQTGQHIRYDAVLVAVGAFAAAVARFRARGGRGCNVTLPFKTDAWRLATARSSRAECAGAVNTLVLRGEDTVFGDNTDGIGLVRDLTGNCGLDLGGMHIVILGAGGAARGIIGPLLEQRPASVVVANRTAQRAHELVAAFAAAGDVCGCGLEGLPGRRVDLLINATSAALAGGPPGLPPGLSLAGSWCYDLVYGDHAEPFRRQALALGARAVWDGLGMLVEQAAESFWLWRGVRPSTGPVIAALRAAH